MFFINFMFNGSFWTFLGGCIVILLVEGFIAKIYEITLDKFAAIIHKPAPNITNFIDSEKADDYRQYKEWKKKNGKENGNSK